MFGYIAGLKIQEEPRQSKAPNYFQNIFTKPNGETEKVKLSNFHMLIFALCPM